MPEEINGATPVSDVSATPVSDNQSPQVTQDNSQSADTTPQEELFNGKPASYWSNLETEHERVKAGQSTLQKKLDRLSNRFSNVNGSIDPAEYEAMNEWMSNPLSQEILQKEADREMKSGLEEMFKEYSTVPEGIKKAIIANYNGFIKPDTRTTADALLDIEEYLIENFSEVPQTQPPKEQPKDFPVVGNNGGVPASTNSKVNQMIEAVKKNGMQSINEIYQSFSEKQIDKATMEEFEATAHKMGLI